MLNHQDRLSREGFDYLIAAAEKFEFDVEKMKIGMTSAEVANQLERDRKAFTERGFKGTPSYVIGSELIQGSRSPQEFKDAIERNLNCGHFGR